MEKEVSRRRFLQGAGIVAAGAVSTGLVACTTTPAPKEPEKPKEQWDAEFDVVVLGYGAAGANAAVAAYEKGAKVLLSEKAPEGEEGGNSVPSGQFVMATDDAQQLYIYLTALMGKFLNWDHEAMMAYCEGCAGNWKWMTETLGGDPDIICGREFPTAPSEQSQTRSWRLMKNPWGLNRDGYVYVWDEFPELEGSQHCMCLTATGTRFDEGYYRLCQKAVQKRLGDKLEIWFAAPGKKLLTNADGDVIGLIINKAGKDMKVKVNGGVVLATGGFEHNPEMIASYLQQPYVHQRGGLFNDGDGIKMAMEIGGDLWHMSNSAGFSYTYQDPDKALATGGPTSSIGVYVGLGGARFMNETAQNRHGRINIGGRWISTPMPLPTYCVHDADQLSRKFMASFSEGYKDEIAAKKVITGATLEELAKNIRESNGGKDAPQFDTDVFVKAINKYNAAYDANVDADYGRPRSNMVPVRKGPFYALKIGPTYFNTMGGPRRNKFAQVIHVNGLPIQGLFSAGELGSIYCDMYNGSGNLGETMVFGRIAGQNAADRAKGEFKGATEKATIWQGK